MFKKLTILALSALLLTNSQIIQTNILDGPGNHVAYGEHNELHGRDNEVGGYRNDVHGDENHVHGDDNNLVGDQNHVHGHENLVQGHQNLVEGKGNIVSGQGNIVVGPDASPADKAKAEAVIVERMQQIFGQRNLQFQN